MGKPKSAVHAVAAPSRAVPLELAPLLKPYRKHGKLSLRVERVQQLARLSRGRNNGDGSWSLGTDELDDLQYLSPDGNDAAHTLAIRIIGVEQDLATLAVLDFPLNLNARQVKRGQDNVPGGEAQRQFEESERLKTTLAERVAELAELQGALQRAETETARQIASAVAAARASWKEELEQHLAARESSEREQSQDTWRAERNALLTETKAREEKRVAEARERWKREAEDARIEAERAWKAAEAARLAKAEADWREKSAKTLADMQVRLERSEAALGDARAKADAAAATSDRDGRRLLEELAGVRAALAAREDELARMRLTAEETQSRQAREAAHGQAQAEAAWKAAEATRFARAEAEWREKSERVLAEAKVRGERAEAVLAEERIRSTEAARAEHRQLAEELKLVRASLADRESELARARSSAGDGAATQAKTDSDEHKRLIAELARIGAALADREAELARARSFAQESAAAQAKTDSDERRRLTDELTSIKSTLAEREADLARTRAAADHSQQQRLQDVEAAIAKAKAEWKEAERVRLEAAEAEWRKGSSAALAAATARCEAAERALARAKGEADRGMGDAIVQGLHDEIAELRRALADRESELAQIRAKEPRIVAPQRITLQEDHGWSAPKPAEAPRRSKSLLLVVQIAVVIILVVTGIVVGPNIEQYIPETVWNLFGYTRLPERPVDASPAAPAQPSERAAPEASAQPTATVARDANVHAAPAMTGAVVTTVERGAAVSVIGEHGNWIHIRIDGDGAKKLEGWVYNTFLSDLPQDSPPSTGAAHQKNAR